MMQMTRRIAILPLHRMNKPAILNRRGSLTLFEDDGEVAGGLLQDAGGAAGVFIVIDKGMNRIGIFSMIVAGLAIAACVGCVVIVPKFTVIYEDLGVMLPNVTRTVVNTSGWMPGGIFLALAVLLLALVALKRARMAGFVAVLTVLLLIATAVVLPQVLLMPISQVVRDVESSGDGGAGQGRGGQPAGRPEVQ
jgi:hypothetical protein